MTKSWPGLSRHNKTPGGYGGYDQAPAAPAPGAQASPWLLPLTSAGKALVTTFIVIGVLCLIGQNVYDNTTLNNGQPTTNAVLISV